MSDLSYIRRPGLVAGCVALLLCFVMNSPALAGPVEDLQKQIDDANREQTALDHQIDYYKKLQTDMEQRNDLFLIDLPNLGIIVPVSSQVLAEMLLLQFCEGRITVEEMGKMADAAKARPDQLKKSLRTLIFSLADRKTKSQARLADLQKKLQVAKAAPPAPPAPPAPVAPAGQAWRLKDNSPIVNPGKKTLVIEKDDSGSRTLDEWTLGEDTFKYHYQLFNKNMNKMIEDFTFEGQVTGLKRDFLKPGDKIEIKLKASSDFAVDAGRFTRRIMDLNWGGGLKKTAVDPAGDTSILSGRTSDGKRVTSMERTVTFEVQAPSKRDTFIEVSVDGIVAVRCEWEPMP